MDFLNFKREICATGVSKESLIQTVQTEMDDLMCRWNIEDFETKVEMEGTISIRSRRFNGRFIISDNSISISGRLPLLAAIRKTRMNKEFDTWLSHAFHATPDL